MAGERILLVQRDPTAALDETLRAQGYSVTSLHHAEGNRQPTLTGWWNVVVVDAALLESGLDRRVFASHCDHLIVHTVNDSDDATDAVSLTSSIYQLLERGSPRQVGPWKLDPTGHSLVRPGERQVLHAQEFRLLQYFTEHPGQVLHRDEILRQVWGYGSGTTTRTLDVHVAKLRHCLGESRHAVHIQTVRGQGYRFIP